MKIDVYQNITYFEEKISFKEFFFVEKEKIIFRITIYYDYLGNKEKIIGNGFTILKLETIKYYAKHLKKIDEYEFIFGNYINILFNDNKIRFQYKDLIACHNVYEMLKEHFKQVIV